MSVIISIKDDLEKLKRQLNAIEREQLPFAASLSMNITAKSAKSDEIEEMKRVFDRPTPFALNSLYIKPSTKTDLRITLWLKDDVFKGTPANKYLAAEVYGGERRMKRFERALQARGYLPAGMVAVPGAGAKLDAYGNISRGQIVQILSALRAFGEQGYAANRARTRKGARTPKGVRKRAEFFVGRPGGGRGPLGVWQRTSFAFGSAVKPVLIFVRSTPYRVRFRFFDVARATFEREWAKQFAYALQFALSTSSKPS